MKILIVLPTAIIGGAERVMFNVAREFVDRGHSVTIYAMSRGRQTGWESLLGRPGFNFIVKEYSSEKNSLLSFFVSMFFITRRTNFDVVWSTHTHVNAALSFLRKIRVLRCRALISRESTFIFERFFGFKKTVFYVLYRFFYGAQDVLVFQTEGMRKSLVGSLGFLPAKKMVVAENPVSSDFIDEVMASEGDFSPKHGFGCVRIVACGRLSPVKRFDVLLEAFSIVLRAHENCRLDIVGDGEMKDRLIQISKDLCIDGKVLFVGRTCNPFSFFKGADVGVVSSEKEGFPNVIVEMMASGVRSIVSTPCTDGVLSLPKIEISHGFSASEIASSIVRRIDRKDDFSQYYRSYVISDRSVSGFILGVLPDAVSGEF